MESGRCCHFLCQSRLAVRGSHQRDWCSNVCCSLGSGAIRKVRGSADKARRGAADAAVLASESAQKTAEADRAWFTPGGPAAGPVLNTTVGAEHIVNGMAVYLTWVNTGKTPALDSKIVATWVLQPRNLPPPHIELEMTHKVGAVVGVGGPASSDPQFLNDEATLVFKTQDVVLFVYGRVEYNDIMERLTSQRRPLGSSSSGALPTTKSNSKKWRSGRLGRKTASPR
jgi:hypothetical protein